MPWLIVLLLLALVPGEFDFDAKSNAGNYQWTPERRELDCLRFIGTTAQSAKEAGVSAVLGKLFTSGMDLSGGEWRKIAIACALGAIADFGRADGGPGRALRIRGLPAFKELSRGRTALIVFHRFSTVRMADRIIVMTHGTIIEVGRHDDLLAAKDDCANLFELQAADYC